MAGTDQAPAIQCVGNYDLGKTIGQGQFGKVKLARHVLTGEIVAIKIIHKTRLDKTALRMIGREVGVMKRLLHPHIIQLYEVLETEKMLFLVLEYASGGEVLDYIVAHGKLNPPEARKFFVQTLDAVDHCHQNRVVHRDLKAENLLLDADRNVKIIDFGLSNMFTPGVLLTTFCGSPTYAAPELLKKRPYKGPEIDVWSMGVLLFVLVTGTLPFDGEDFRSLFAKILVANYTIPQYVPPVVADLISRLLVVDPNERATVAQIREHPWLQDGPNVPRAVAPAGGAAGQGRELDRSVLQHLESLGFDAESTVESIRQNKYDVAASTYYLLLRKKEKEERRLREVEERKRQLRRKLQEHHAKSRGHKRGVSYGGPSCGAPLASPGPSTMVRIPLGSPDASPPQSLRTSSEDVKATTSAPASTVASQVLPPAASASSSSTPATPQPSTSPPSSASPLPPPAVSFTPSAAAAAGDKKPSTAAPSSPERREQQGGEGEGANGDRLVARLLAPHVEEASGGFVPTHRRARTHGGITVAAYPASPAVASSGEDSEDRQQPRASGDRGSRIVHNSAERRKNRPKRRSMRMDTFSDAAHQPVVATRWTHERGGGGGGEKGSGAEGEPRRSADGRERRSGEADDEEWHRRPKSQLPPEVVVHAPSARPNSVSPPAKASPQQTPSSMGLAPSASAGSSLAVAGSSGRASPGHASSSSDARQLSTPSPTSRWSGGAAAAAQSGEPSSSSSASSSSTSAAAAAAHKKGHRRTQSGMPSLLLNIRNKFLGKAPAQEEKLSHDNKEPRLVRGAVSNANTSSKDPEEIMADIHRVLRDLRVHIEFQTHYTVECSLRGVSLIVELCQMPGISKMYYVHVKRLTGDLMEFKELCNQFYGNLAL